MLSELISLEGMTFLIGHRGIVPHTYQHTREEWQNLLQWLEQIKVDGDCGGCYETIKFNYYCGLGRGKSATHSLLECAIDTIREGLPND